MQGGEWAANFAPYPELESLVQTVSRSQSVTVRSPGIEDSVAEIIVFDWDTEAAGPITLRIISNIGRDVRAFSNQTSPVKLSLSLKPGLYYWKLEDRNDLLYVGKFFVR